MIFRLSQQHFHMVYCLLQRNRASTKNRNRPEIPAGRAITGMERCSLHGMAATSPARNGAGAPETVFRNAAGVQISPACEKRFPEGGLWFVRSVIVVKATAVNVMSAGLQRVPPRVGDVPPQRKASLPCYVLLLRYPGGKASEILHGLSVQAFATLQGLFHTDCKDR